MSMKEGVCKLCLKVSLLCKESHIIPKFLYKFIKENNKLVFIDSTKKKIRFNGEYESGILCIDCDRRVIGKNEDYYSKFISGLLPNSDAVRQTIAGRDMLIWNEGSSYDYKKFKLFLLSLLWRASISSRPFFQNVKLPPRVEEDLRQRILSQNPGDSVDYASYIHLPPLIMDSEGRIGFYKFYMPTLSPLYVESDGVHICEFVIEGVHYYFLMSAPVGWKIEPAVEEKKLTVAFSTKEDQDKIIQSILENIKMHKIDKERS